MATNTSVEINVFDDPIFYVYLVSQIAIYFSVPSQLLLLYQIRKHRINYFSANLTINIVCWCLFLSNGTILGHYMMFNLESKEKSGYYVFFGGGLHATLGQTVGVSVTFLCLDRTIALLAPLSYKRHRKLFVTITILTCILWPSTNFVTMMIMDFPTMKALTPCKSLSCVVSGQTAMVFSINKISCGCLSIILSIVFLATLWKYVENASMSESSRAQIRKENNIVLAAIASEVCFGITPHMITTIAGFLKISLVGLGPFMSTAIAMDSVVTAISYRLLIMRRLNKNSPTVIQTMTSSPIHKN